MINNIHRRSSRLPLVVLAIATIGSMGCAKGRPKMQTPAAIDQIIADLQIAKKFDRATIERVTHSTLVPTSETNSFQTYQAKGIKGNSLTIDLELREPKEGSSATAGPLFVIHVVQGCPRKSDVEARYSPWKLTDVPRGGSLDEQAYWTRYETWGELSFGFAERAPDCLSTVAFNVKNRAGEVR